MIPFQYQRAPSVQDAIGAALEGGRYIAGGTTLVDLMRDEVERPRHLVDINGLAFDEVRADGPDLVIGALARMADVAAHPGTQRMQPMLAEALIEGASPQLRNMATIGGNLLQRCRCPYFRMLDAPCNKRQAATGCSAINGSTAGHAILGTSNHCIAAHPSDLAVALVGLDATMLVSGPNGERSLAVESLFRQPGDTPHVEHNLEPGELITEIRVPGLLDAGRAKYLKVRDRASYEFALVSAAVSVRIEGGVIRILRIACGGVGTRPWRMRSVEQELVGKAATRANLEAAAELAIEGARTFEGNHFKVELLPRTIVRAIEIAGEIA